MIGYSLVAFIYLFIAFVFVVKVKHRVAGTKYELPAKLLLVVPFAIFDWVVNIIISPWFLDPPKGIELVTGRMKRYKKRYMNLTRYEMNPLEVWRLQFAIWLCKRLNQHDHNHC